MNSSRSFRIKYLVAAYANLGINALTFYFITRPVINDSGGPHGYIKLFLLPLFVLHLLIIAAIAELRNKRSSQGLYIINLIVIALGCMLLYLRFLAGLRIAD